MLSTANGRAYVTWGILNAVVIVVGFAIGVIWGPLGVAIGYVISTYLLLGPSLVLALRGTCLKPADFFEPLAYPALGSLAGVATTWAMEATIVFGRPLFELIGLGAVFAATIMVFLVIFPVARAEVLGFIRLVLPGRNAASPVK